ncbi:GNAT family N-acetyltransferase [Glycomyces tritici]|uniref:GNAT family N-acetyltransferase n=1 Tax=Glycomyces tritici TaxID=2665176 RepID=A0ABT7YLN7_9ACTN|nr:GNAT family N-acetyltransferase [Glycomyces tritici]MDN3239541.1 GNAT family N-acetyltransferase [Glycomyces tritici]
MAVSTAHVAGLLAEAFVDAPTAVWLVEDPADRLAAMEGQFAMLAEHAAVHGGVLTAGADGALVWFDRTVEVPPIPEYDERLRAACGKHYEGFAELDRIMDEHHPAEPHNYVALVGVRADARGRGIASDLFRRHHERLDASGTPAYLEAVSLQTARLYASLGYRPHGAPFRIGEGGPPLHPMWRPAGAV